MHATRQLHVAFCRNLLSDFRRAGTELGCQASARMPNTHQSEMPYDDSAGPERPGECERGKRRAAIWTSTRSVPGRPARLVSI
jgi:hypothetical protein